MWFNAHYLSWITGIVFLQDVNSQPLKLHFKALRKHVCQSDRSHMLQEMLGFFGGYCKSAVSLSLSSLPHACFKEREANLGSPQAGIYRIFLFSLGLFPSLCLSDSLLRGSLKGVTAENNAQSFRGEDIDWGARGWRSKAKVGMREWLMVRGETKELIGGNNDQKKDESVKAGMITKDISLV